jgi:chaperonin cofactor prefoldin
VDILECTKQVRDEISLMEKLIRKYFTETSDIKTTSALRVKLEKLNERLNTLNNRVTEMYAKYQSIKERIPCFASKCIGG